MVSFLPNGIFLVRFDIKEHQQAVVSNGHLLFDSKPVIVKEWSPDAELIKHDVKVVSVWMKLFGLDVKFWGKFIKSDVATSRRAFLRYARVLIEVRVDQRFPEELKFYDEIGKLQVIRVEYDWLPIVYTNCKGMGHKIDQCRRSGQGGKVKRVWRPKVVVPVQSQPQSQFVPATPMSAAAPPPTGNVVTGEASFPRRIIARMLRNNSGTSRLYTPGGVSFIEALNLSIQKGRGEMVANERVIHAKVLDKVRNKQFSFSLVYGMNKPDERVSLWRSLKAYTAYVSGAWAVCGDFNCLLGLNERIGGNEVVHDDILPLRDVTDFCQLQDLNAIGSFFTWNNKHEVGMKIYSRIDRVLVNTQWLDIFPDSFANFLPEGLFDHCPCLINFHETLVNRKLPFKYYNMWALAKEFEQIVRNSWSMVVVGSPMFKLVRKLQSLKNPLRSLNKEQFSDIENLAHVASLTLQHYYRLLVGDPLNKDMCDAERQCAKEADDLLHARNAYLMQKAKEMWIEDGDDNTSFFHASIKRRRMRNRVYQVFDADNNLCTTPDQIMNAFENFYVSLLGDAKPVSPIHRRVVQAGKCITHDHIAILTADVTHEEIKSAMFDIPGTKAPGPDGYSSQFFKDSWDIVGNDMVAAIQDVFSSGQSCSPRVLLKVDLQKAYDSFEWSFVLDMMEALGFPRRFVSLIAQCISSPSYSIAINGEVFGFFKGRRGLRQGDPLSPLLFTICLEYLSRVLETVQKHRLFRFHPLCKSMGLSHLCFADDLLLFCKGDENSVMLLLRAFETFSKASGLKMSPRKSCIYSNGVAEGLIKRLVDGVGIQRGRVPFKYLGVTISPKKLSVADCACLVDRVTEKIRGLGARHLSYTGRVVLTRSVLLSLHCYWARIFILPKTVLSKVEAICRVFLWHGSGASNGPVFVSWEQICRPCKNGGLGFVRLHQWNVAALGKYVWWVQIKADHLWVRWVHVVYLKGRSWDDYTPGSNTSWGWRKLCWVKDKLRMLLVGAARYSTSEIYGQLVDMGSKVVWHPWISTRLIIPKYRFILWLAIQGCLLTQDRLVRMRIICNNCCFLCGADVKSHEHLFFECGYSRQCLQALAQWLGVCIPIRDAFMWWVRLKVRSMAQKQIIGLAMASLIYRIWWARNTSRVELYVVRPSKLCNEIKGDVLTRVRVCKFHIICSRARQ
ncbi:hypothetical protein RND81_06G036400 [Saponaria officinalis]|uniref:Reverse transcriptase domain-containing protein n=1 Tax=Saponaria officinalis TaxID=3572 RepID=A0AAW1K415_SAPOF